MATPRLAWQQLFGNEREWDSHRLTLHAADAQHLVPSNILTPNEIDNYRENDDFSVIEGIIENRCQELFSVDLPNIINFFRNVLEDAI